ncbi:MAG: SusD/RagB family nutrient-binding outer membrane lipoprotein, partial [Bacteroidales bacterium]|nr:SusD/RagB family nutrient-binding outer membrane lipoprotein [Bacteroidales bacterium]
MKRYILSLTVLIAAATTLLTGCAKDFAELNQDPAAITTANVSYLYAQCVNEFEPQGYLEYYYNAPMFFAWSGMGISTSGASESILTLTATGGRGSQYVSTLRYVREIEHVMESYDDDEYATNIPYLAAAKVLTVYLGIFDSDMYGAMPYSEACRARYGGTLTPEYDSMETLYETWLDELDEAIEIFTDESAYMTGSQDVVYGGDVAKWAKFANSLKLRIAVRYLAQDSSKAKSIANEVTSASCGYIDALDEDVLFNKCTISNNSNDYVYHWSNGFTGCAGSQSVINFMVDNRDPRVRFFYKKNEWNSTIVQGFYDAGLEIPDFIEKNVTSGTDDDGNKIFLEWGGETGLGEPWVRYYGMTEDWMASTSTDGTYKWFFPSAYPNMDAELCLHDSDGRNATTYTVYSTFNQMMVIGRYYT